MILHLLIKMQYTKDTPIGFLFRSKQVVIASGDICCKCNKIIVWLNLTCQLLSNVLALELLYLLGSNTEHSFKCQWLDLYSGPCSYVYAPLNLGTRGQPCTLYSRNPSSSSYCLWKEEFTQFHSCISFPICLDSTCLDDLVIAKIILTLNV